MAKTRVNVRSGNGCRTKPNIYTKGNIVCGDEGSLVLITKGAAGTKFSGVVIESSRRGKGTGYLSDRWLKTDFEQFVGDLSLAVTK